MQLMLEQEQMGKTLAAFKNCFQQSWHLSKKKHYKVCMFQSIIKLGELVNALEMNSI